MLTALLEPSAALALPAEHYTANSALSQGRWMKVRIDNDGLYRIPVSTLRSWGFSDLSRVRVFGYGGRRISDALTADQYIDDLPVAPCELTDRGLVFYGVGATNIATTAGYRHREQNPYSAFGYYFVGELPESADGTSMPQTGAPRISADATRSFEQLLHYERELQLFADAGPLMTGEDFRYTRTRNFAMDFTDAVDGGTARLECSFTANLSASGTVSVNIDGSTLGNISVLPKSRDEHVHGTEGIGRYSFAASPGRHSIGLTFNGGGNVTLANLNYISVGYERALKLPASGHLVFDSSAATFALADTRDDLRIWDVTSLSAPASIDYTVAEGEAHWSMDSRMQRSFAAWVPTADMPQPVTVGAVAAQNLHGEEGAELVIICPTSYSDAAARLADYHRTCENPLTVKVVDPQKIYNEFSSGSADVSGLRKYLKMLYDRGNTGAGPALRYVILMARTTLDNRGLSADAPSYPTLPAWMPSAVSASMSDNAGFCTDDFVAMLGDGSGADMRRDKLSVAVGRMPEHAKQHGNSASYSWPMMATKASI